MSLISWLLKPKKEMAKKTTKRVRIGKYIVSSHAQNRTAQPSRKLKKSYMINNLYKKPLYNTDVRIDDKGRPSYMRVGKHSANWINPKTKVITSTKKTSINDIKKGEKYGYKVKK